MRLQDNQPEAEHFDEALRIMGEPPHTEEGYELEIHHRERGLASNSTNNSDIANQVYSSSGT